MGENHFPNETWAVLHDGQTVIGHVVLSFRTVCQDGDWQSACVELNVPSFGAGPGEALDNAIEATIEYLNAIEEAGERDRVFADHSVRLVQGPPIDGHLKEEMAPGEFGGVLELALAVGE